MGKGAREERDGRLLREVCGMEGKRRARALVGGAEELSKKKGYRIEGRGGWSSRGMKKRAERAVLLRETTLS